MEALIRQRLRASNKLSRITKFTDNLHLGTISQADIHIRLETMAEIWHEFDTVQTQIECACSDSDLTSQQTSQETFEQEFYTTKAILLQSVDSKTNLNITNIESNSSPSAHDHTRQSQIRLPKIELPIFTGSYQQWASFADLFTSVIHDNPSLSPVQKLHYLKSSIKGEAAGLLTSITITDANYSEAWAILKHRYSNKRQSIQAHLKTLYAQPKLTQESPRDIRKLLDTTIENVRALTALGLPTTQWDHLITFLVTERLDPGSRREWELKVADQEDTKFVELQQFLETRCRALEAAVQDKHITHKGFNQHPKPPKQASVYHATTAECVKCKAMHPLFACDDFLKLKIPERIEFARATSLCLNCLKGGHTSKNCNSSSCRKCGKYHNTLLHVERTPNSTRANSPPRVVNNHHAGKIPLKDTHTLLATAVLMIQDQFGRYHKARALLDAGSQASFITEECIQRLQLRRSRSDTIITGLGSSNIGTSKGIVDITLSPRLRNIQYHTTAYILPRITESMPPVQVNFNTVSNLVKRKNLQLADPEYFKPSTIDLLLGAEIYYDTLANGKFKDHTSKLVIQNTTLGWIIAGSTNLNKNSLSGIRSHMVVENLTEGLRKFWELEEIPHIQQQTQEEIRSESHFVRTHTRNDQGRFIVDLPFTQDLPNIGQTYDMSLHRLKQIERRLERNPEHKGEYLAFMKEYLDLGHMSATEPGQSGPTYHLPHHYVIQTNSTSTKLRVVFDGSATPSTGMSLNQAMMVGPTIQNNLNTIVTRFRMHNVAFTADISKMYRQVLVNANGQRYQRILWRFDPTQPVQEYTLNTVTYGTSAAPFLAIRSLVELSNVADSKYLKAADIIKQDFYVDDVMSGADNIELALTVKSELVRLLESGGFSLHKWRSNRMEFFDPSQTTSNSAQTPLEIETTNAKTLGIFWDSKCDCFTFIAHHQELQPITKRSILSYTSKLFDPLGWVAPVVITAKLIMQELWLLNIGWDEPLPESITSTWMKYSSGLLSISRLRIPRKMVTDSTINCFQIHGFSDASERAYGAAVYIRSPGLDSYHVQLITSKSRVAPLKQVSLPRLELCGAVLLAQLINSVKIMLGTRIDTIFAWTDSLVVLSWLNKPPQHWKTFVANRVSQIHDLLPPEHWRHVRSEDNPADYLTRGMSSIEILDNTKWWNGPNWLTHHQSEWPTSAIERVPSDAEARKPCHKYSLHSAVVTSPDTSLMYKYSSWYRLMEVTAYCFRFARSCLKRVRSASLSLTQEERLQAEQHWIKQAQNDNYGTEIRQCINQKSLHHSSSLISLNPFIDDHGILRVGGRIDKASVSYDQRHPIILPHTHQITKLIIRSHHLHHLHAGPQLLASILRLKYWIIKVKQTIRAVIHKCTICFRHRLTTSQQLMGELPRQRLEPVRPFVRCGIDYAGPITIKTDKSRGRVKMFKSYICIMVCFVTKAIHLELAGDLSTATFMGALKRFACRRGKPSDIYTDCGTNFVGAGNELQSLITSPEYHQTISRDLMRDGIRWHYNPPAAPHFGGLWEAGVKSTKYHLRRIMGLSILTYEELNTLLVQVEGCLNSRPLCALSTDPNDLIPLTPGHFLIGEALSTIPEPDYLITNANLLDRWKLTQRLFQQFWKQWTQEYLARLQQRPKWCSKTINLKAGDLVILKGESNSPLQWPMARIIQTHPGMDNLVRTVTLKTATGILKRPITKCCKLPMDDEHLNDQSVTSA